MQTSSPLPIGEYIEYYIHSLFSKEDAPNGAKTKINQNKGGVYYGTQIIQNKGTGKNAFRK